MSTRSRVIISGMGAVSALGVGVPQLWKAARDGASGVKNISFERYPAQKVKIAAHLPDFDAATHIGEKLATETDRFAAMALVATAEALKQSGTDTDQPLGDRTAVILGSGIGGASTADNQHWNFYHGNERPDIMTVPKVMPSAAASHVSMLYGARGPSFAVSSACSSAAQAIGLGHMLIRSGAVDRAIVGGSEALLTPATFRAWEALRVLAPDACRPFSKRRSGMVLGEGAAVLVLESEEFLAKRRGTAIAELAGYGTTSDARDLLRPDPECAARAIALALENAELQPEDIGYVNAHGTATIVNDINECLALQTVFGDRAREIPVSSTKPMHGHTLGAAGAIELVVTVKALVDQIAPPTQNFLEPDPKCPVDPVAGSSRPISCKAAISNSFAFGGINACLAVRTIA